MSMYNLIHGTQPAAKLVITLLHLADPALRPDAGYFGRLRDAWIEKGKDGALVLAVYTRNGGGNRQCYGGGDDCKCPGCTITRVLPADPLYLSDHDDDFDCTYATVYFRVPDNADVLLKAGGAPQGVALLGELAQDPPDMQARWESAIAAIGKAT